MEVVFPRGTDTVGYKLGAGVTTEEFDEWKPIDEQMGHDERIRLLYVACTRACDHLVVSLHRTERKAPLPNRRTNAETLLAGMGEDVLAGLPDVGGLADPLTADPHAAPTAPPPFEEWEATREAAVRSASRPVAVAATALTDEGTPDQGPDRPAPTHPTPTSTHPTPTSVHPTQLVMDLDQNDTDSPQAAGEVVDPGLQKRPRDLDLPPWLKGRYGTSVGRAVHGVLQTIDLATGEGLDAAVAAQCQAEAVPDRADDVRRLVQDALGASVVQEAAAAPHWREIYACTPLGDRLLEGYVDLLYRGADGLVVVDHKTAATAEPAELDRRVQGYRLQGAAYAVAVGAATGEPVTRVVFLFLTPSGAVERELDDLAAAMADVERLVRDGQELVTA